MQKFIIGQRWISKLELNLGLGIVSDIKERQVEISYPASDCARLYSIGSAPLRRVVFKPGDTVEYRDGSNFTVLSISENDGLFIYYGENLKLPEQELKDSLSFTSPVDRFNQQIFDNIRDFNLRIKAIFFQNELRKSPVRGFIGGRIDLIAHQLYIAHEVSTRINPRVLLSDETGLGKTIEACLILHRMLLSERIRRVLILLPESLVHQWFVELLRKFNLIFKIVEKNPAVSGSVSHNSGNHLMDNRLWLCDIAILTSDAAMRTMALEAEWDLIIIDEAHHLIEGGPEYLLAEKLGQISKGLLLLTATPEQWGFKSHFARLHLLDPSRYFDYKLFQKEEARYLAIARIVEKLVCKETLSASEKKILGYDPSQKSGDDSESLIEELIDRLGTGRAIFQNGRSEMKGFPSREVHLVPIKAVEEDLSHQTREFKTDLKGFFKPELEAGNGNDFFESSLDFSNDKRIHWLVSLAMRPSREKILLICSSKEKARAIEESLRNLTKIKTDLFHEDLSLLQRDRNASRFADEDGAQVLICSEIGSEGRNFQFAHNLVLFDVPFNPELLEQRIGRLDRIGQEESIHIYVPYFSGSEYEILVRWYHEGLNEFTQNIPGVHVIFQEMENKLMDVAENKRFWECDGLISETKKTCEKVTQKFRQGKDRLLRHNSFQPEIAKDLIAQIQKADGSKEYEEFVLNLFAAYGIEEDLISEKTYKLNLSMLTTDEISLPVRRTDDLIVTFDRKTAVSHEDIEFISRDHPMVTDVLDYFLSSEKGNSSVALIPPSKEQVILLETIYILETISPPGLFIDRFLPPTPVRVIINHCFNDSESDYPVNYLFLHAMNGSYAKILDNLSFKHELFPAMLKKCAELATMKSTMIRNACLTQMENVMKAEIDRLEKLKKINPHFHNEELDDLSKEHALMRSALINSRLRLDAMRLILSAES